MIHRSMEEQVLFAYQDQLVSLIYNGNVYTGQLRERSDVSGSLFYEVESGLVIIRFTPANMIKALSTSTPEPVFWLKDRVMR